MRNGPRVRVAALREAEKADRKRLRDRHHHGAHRGRRLLRKVPEKVNRIHFKSQISKAFFLRWRMYLDPGTHNGSGPSQFQKSNQSTVEYPASARSEKNFRAASILRAICARSASGPENFCSSRIRAWKRTSIGPLVRFSLNPNKWLSTVTPTPLNVGRVPTFVTDEYSFRPTAHSVAYTPSLGSSSCSGAIFRVGKRIVRPRPAPAPISPVRENARPSSGIAPSTLPLATAVRIAVLETICPPTSTGETIPTSNPSRFPNSPSSRTSPAPRCPNRKLAPTRMAPARKHPTRIRSINSSGETSDSAWSNRRTSAASTPICSTPASRCESV